MKALEITYLSSDAEEVSVDKPKRKPFRRIRMFLILLLCILLSFGITVWLHTPSGKAARFCVEKKMYQMTDLYDASDPALSNRKDVITIRIEDPKDLPRAETFMPELLKPSWIPEGWEFESLALFKTLRGIKTADYVYSDKNDQELFVMEYKQMGDEEINLFTISEEMSLEGRKLLLSENPVTGHDAVIFFQDDLMIQVCGDIEKETMIEIVKHM